MCVTAKTMPRPQVFPGTSRQGGHDESCQKKTVYGILFAS
jgi:hypothetical protein